MKKLLILFVVIVKINSIYAQEFDTIPPYQKDSLHLTGNGITLIADSMYKGAAIIH